MSGLNRSVIALAAMAVTAPLAAIATPAVAQQEKSFTECRQIENEEERLACYDRLAGAIASVPEEKREEAIERQPTEIVTAPTEEEKARLSQEDNLARQVEEEQNLFGIERLWNRGEEEEVLDNLTQPITAYRILPRGEIRVVLDNGQVWDQLASDRRRLQRVDDRWVQTAIITRGALGSYRMKVEPIGETIKVKRTR